MLTHYFAKPALQNVLERKKICDMNKTFCDICVIMLYMFLRQVTMISLWQAVIEWEAQKAAKALENRLLHA